MAIPVQERAVDPFSSYHSDNVSRLTRVLTAGQDKIVRDEDLLPSIESVGVSIVDITKGIAIKDDILIHVTDDFELDASDPFNYNQGTLLNYPTVDTTYIVLKYKYVKTPQTVEAEIIFLNNKNEYDTDYHIFLGMAHFDSATTIDSISVDDNPVFRPVANLTDPYTDQDARDAQNIGNNNIELQWTGTAIPYSHLLGLYPTVSIMDNNGAPYQGEFVQAIIKHTNTDTITIDFDPFNTPNPYNFILIY